MRYCGDATWLVVRRGFGFFFAVRRQLPVDTWSHDATGTADRELNFVVFGFKTRSVRFHNNCYRHQSRPVAITRTILRFNIVAIVTSCTALVLRGKPTRIRFFFSIPFHMNNERRQFCRLFAWYYAQRFPFTEVHDRWPLNHSPPMVGVGGRGTRGDDILWPYEKYNI